MTRVAKGWKISGKFPATLQKIMVNFQKSQKVSKIPGKFPKFTGNFPTFCNPNDDITEFNNEMPLTEN